MNLGEAMSRYEIPSQARGFLLCPRLCTRNDFFPQSPKIPGKQSGHQKTEGLTRGGGRGLSTWGILRKLVAHWIKDGHLAKMNQ